MMVMVDNTTSDPNDKAKKSATESSNEQVDEKSEQVPSGKTKKNINYKRMYFFVANICIVNIFYMILTAYTNGVVRTIERRFDLSSSHTGFLNSCNDIVHICVVVFVGYFGRKGNKPRIMCVTAMFTCLAGVLNATPHFLFPEHSSRGNDQLESLRRQNSLTVSENGKKSFMLSSASLQNSTNESFGSSELNYCVKSGFLNVSDEENCSHNDVSRLHPAFYVFLVAQLINGIGSSGIFTLSMAYIDENAPKNKASVFVGTYLSLFTLGPVFGLLLSSVCLKLPENLLSGEPVNTADPSFIGCWWLGYLVGGIGMTLSVFPLWFYPSNLKKYNSTCKTEIDDETSTFMESGRKIKDSRFLAQLKGVPSSFASLLSNRLYLVNLCQIVCEAYTAYGVFVNLVRYLEVHFLRTAAEASIIASILLAVTGTIGGFVGGALTSKLNLKAVNGLFSVLMSSVIFTAGLIILINLGCPQINMDMALDDSLKMNTVNNECNANCQCSTARADFHPICGSDNITYFSPCIAGCSRMVGETFIDCKCIKSNGTKKGNDSVSDIHEATAAAGYCISKCGLLIPFAVTLFVVAFVASVAKVPSTMVTFRIVKDEERSFALGVNSFILNLFGFIPGPLVFGYLIDSSCKLWQRTCSGTGTCLLFNTDRLRNSIYGTSIVVEGIKFTCNLTLLLLIRKIPLGKAPLSRQSDLVIDVNI